MYNTVICKRNSGKVAALIIYTIKCLKEYKTKHNDEPLLIDWDDDKNCGVWYEYSENELIKHFMPEFFTLADMAFICNAVNHGATEKQIHEYLKER